MTSFRYTSHAQDIIFSPGVMGQLGAVVEQRGWRRVLVCATGHRYL